MTTSDITIKHQPELHLLKAHVTTRSDQSTLMIGMELRYNDGPDYPLTREEATAKVAEWVAEQIIDDHSEKRDK